MSPVSPVFHTVVAVSIGLKTQSRVGTRPGGNIHSIIIVDDEEEDLSTPPAAKKDLRDHI